MCLLRIRPPYHSHGTHSVVYIIRYLLEVTPEISLGKDVGDFNGCAERVSIGYTGAQVGQAACIEFTRILIIKGLALLILVLAYCHSSAARHYNYEVSFEVLFSHFSDLSFRVRDVGAASKYNYSWYLAKDNWSAHVSYLHVGYRASAHSNVSCYASNIVS